MILRFVTCLPKAEIIITVLDMGAKGKDCKLSTLGPDLSANAASGLQCLVKEEIVSGALNFCLGEICKLRSLLPFPHTHTHTNGTLCKCFRYARPSALDLLAASPVRLQQKYTHPQRAEALERGDSAK